AETASSCPVTVRLRGEPLVPTYMFELTWNPSLPPLRAAFMKMDPGAPMYRSPVPCWSLMKQLDRPMRHVPSARPRTTALLTSALSPPLTPSAQDPSPLP